MRNRLPPLGWLRTFEAAARHLSFTGAARDLNMTQSAVSQQIKALEAHLGQSLFHRRPRVLELTATGTAYLPVVRESFRTLERGTRAITGHRLGEIRLQCNLSFAVHWLAPRLGKLHATHPEIRLNISTELWEPREMAPGADVEIRYSLRPADSVRAELLHRDRYFPVCAPDYHVTLETLAKHQLYDCSGLLGNWASWAEDLPLAWPDPPITHATTYCVALSVAEAGGGLCLAHHVIAERLIAQGRLVTPFEHEAPMPEAYYLILAPSSDERGEVRTFVAWLRSEIACHSTESGRLGIHA